MRTKYILHIGKSEYELRDDDLMNWDDVKCSYKREDYGGIVRSFTSQFEFVNEARRLLLDLYMADGFNSKAYVSVHTQNNSWGFDKRFECQLDFSTISWEGHVLRINCVDSSLSSLIKANKGTKYEFVVGKEIVRDSVLSFDRMPMMETLTYEFTQGEYSETSSAVQVTFKPNELPYLGIVAKEITVNGNIFWNDDQTDSLSSFILKAENNIDVEFEFDLEWNTIYSSANGIDLGIYIRRGGNTVTPTGGIEDGKGGVFATLRLYRIRAVGNISDPGSLPSASTALESDSANPYQYAYAIITGNVWVLKYNGRGYEWINTGKKTPSEYFMERLTGKVSLKLQAGDVVFMRHDFSSGNASVTINFINNKFVFGWMGIGGVANIDVLSPLSVAKALVERMTGGRMLVDVIISGHDSRLSDTYVLAAESARGIIGAKLYSSFGEFCDWMSAVFGYVYRLDGCVSARFLYSRECGEYEYSPWHYEPDTWTGEVSSENIVYIAGHGRFLYHEPGTNNLYLYWDGWQDYNSTETGYARTDTLFRIKELSEDALYCFDSYDGGYMTPQVYDGSIDDLGKERQTISFVHRTELFSPYASISRFSESKNHKYSVDTGCIYSTVTAGYDKKDYQSINGRDEYNFSNTYSTGCSVSDKTLSLMSKYRADSYGIEFAVQKRGEDTTDTTSDKDVFFILCTRQGGRLVPDRTVAIENAISDRIFNGAFSPMACIRANAGFIGMQSNVLTLAFASSSGNSEIVIDGEPVKADITLDTPLATCGVLEFEAANAFSEEDEGNMIEVSDSEYTYRGFLQEVDTMYARAETTKCKMIVKEVSPC